MSSKFKKIIKSLIPPLVLNLGLGLFDHYGFKGEYKDWLSAQNISSGYNSEIILNKTKEALLKVKNGEAAYERDSVLFDKPEYNWSLLTILLHIASINNNNLSLIDFGGSLGSSYYQNKIFLNSLKSLAWNVVEQGTVAECGQQNFANQHLKFYSQPDECSQENQPNLVLFSASLQYLPEPYEVLRQFFNRGIRYIFIDRLLVNDIRDLISVQIVNPKIYKASYPVWIFKENNILDFLNKNNYKLITSFEALGGAQFIKKVGVKADYKAYLFELMDYDL